ncbi:hypothetical protein GVAV_000368 [Gurleya vavrai]
MRKVRGYIHSHEEAMLIMHAIRLGLFRPATERPTMEEREAIASGSIFCFIECEEGMKRWTDGKIWSPSKILGHFLLYKEVPRHLSKSALKKDKVEYERRRKYVYEQSKRDFDSDDDFTLYKKTISLEHEKKTYHIISYFQPFFDKRSIISLKFFKDLQNSLSINECLPYDQFLMDAKNRGEDIYEKFKVPIPTKENLMLKIDRSELEKHALSVLRGKINNNKK